MQGSTDSAIVASSAVLCRILQPAGTSRQTGEKRAFPRWQVRFPVLHGEAAPRLVGLAADVNDDGISFLTRVPYKVDTVLSLELRIPSGPIQVKGLVRHAGRGTAGVQFLNISRQQRLALLDYCLGRGDKKPN